LARYQSFGRYGVPFNAVYGPARPDKHNLIMQEETAGDHPIPLLPQLSTDPLQERPLGSRGVDSPPVRGA
jgi:hypothetical protein